MNVSFLGILLSNVRFESGRPQTRGPRRQTNEASKARTIELDNSESYIDATIYDIIISTILLSSSTL